MMSLTKILTVRANILILRWKRTHINSALAEDWYKNDYPDEESPSGEENEGGSEGSGMSLGAGIS